MDAPTFWSSTVFAATLLRGPNLLLLRDMARESIKVFQGAGCL